MQRRDGLAGGQEDRYLRLDARCRRPLSESHRLAPPPATSCWQAALASDQGVVGDQPTRGQRGGRLAWEMLRNVQWQVVEEMTQDRQVTREVVQHPTGRG